MNLDGEIKVAFKGQCLFSFTCMTASVQARVGRLVCVPGAMSNGGPTFYDIADGSGVSEDVENELGRFVLLHGGQGKVCRGWSRQLQPR